MNRGVEIDSELADDLDRSAISIGTNGRGSKNGLFKNYSRKQKKNAK